MVQVLTPVIKVAGYAFGGVTAVIGKALDYGTTVYNSLTDPTSYISSFTKSDLFNSVKDYAANSRLGQTVMGVYNKGKDFAQNGLEKVKEYTANNGLDQTIMGAYNKGKDFVQQGLVKMKDYSENSRLGQTFMRASN